MSEICSHCHIGSPKTQLGAWARIVGSHLVLVPGITTAVCDICGWVEYDPVILNQLEALLQFGSPPDVAGSAQAPLQPEETEWLKKWAIYNA